MINSISKTDQLKELILRDIKRGIFKPGGALPAIHEFCERYKVSKHTVSQALSNLSELGIVDTAPGKISRVAEFVQALQVDIIYAGRTPLDRQVFWGDVHLGMLDAFSGHSVRCREFALGGSFPENVELAKTRGAILLGSVKDEIVDLLKRHSVPFVQVFDRPSHSPASVNCGMMEAVDSIIGHFAAKGLARLAYIDRFHVENGQSLNAAKYSCLMDCAKRRGLECRYLHSNAGLAEAYAATMELFKGPGVDGLLLSSDYLAPGVYRAIHDSGLRIPDGVEVASFDNLELAGYMLPSLSSVDFRRREAGAKAGAKLLDLMDGREPSDAHERIEAKLILRESLRN